MQDVPKPQPSGHVARLPRVRDLTGASSATIWRWTKVDPSFPKPFHPSPAITCWDEREVLDWIEQKKAQRVVQS